MSGKNDGYEIGDKLILVAHTGSEFPVTVRDKPVGIVCDLIVEWTGNRPLNAFSLLSTICLNDLQEIRLG